jgi:hypothetical protein
MTATPAQRRWDGAAADRFTSGRSAKA